MTDHPLIATRRLIIPLVAPPPPPYSWQHRHYNLVISLYREKTWSCFNEKVINTQ